MSGRNLSGVMLQALTAVAQDVLVELWEVDLRPFGGDINRFCTQVNEKNGAVVWQGHEYHAYPVKAEGFESRATGTGNRPTLTLANAFGLVTGLSVQYGGLTGAAVTRRLTYGRFLDAANFVQGNPNADPTQEIVMFFTLERISSLSAKQAVLELAAPSEGDGAVVPSRLMLAGVCPWKYRGEECGYTGRAVADRFDLPTSDPKKDECSRSLTGCKARFGADAVLPFGGVPSASKV